MKYFWTALLTAGLSGAAMADDVLLTNGRTLVGIAREEPGRVVIETRLGDIGIPRDQVQSIATGRTPIHEYKERLANLDNGCASAAETFELAEWARSQGLVRYVNGLLQRTIESDPDHAEARRLLGFVRHEDRWVPASERRAVQQEEERRHRTQTASRPAPTLPIRRTTPRPEETPYSLGIPPGPPPRGSQRYDGGYGYWGWPVGARVFTAPVPASGSLR
jgi:hypothetical protein